jgi:hypothetical protein
MPTGQYYYPHVWAPALIDTPFSFLSNKGAVAGTFLAVGAAALLGIWLLINFLQRRMRRARRAARERQYEEDMAVGYEKKGPHDVELEPSTRGHDDPDASFGNHVHGSADDMDDVAAVAPANAYPDRAVHYGYDQAAYNNNYAAQPYGQQYVHGQEYAHGQEYTNYGVEYPPTQAGAQYGGYDAHYQQQQYPDYNQQHSGYQQQPQYPAGAQGHQAAYAE